MQIYENIHNMGEFLFHGGGRFFPLLPCHTIISPICANPTARERKREAGRRRLTNNAKMQDNVKIKKVFYPTVEGVSSYFFIDTLPNATSMNPKTHGKRRDAGRSRLTQMQRCKTIRKLSRRNLPRWKVFLPTSSLSHY